MQREPRLLAGVGPLSLMFSLSPHLAVKRNLKGPILSKGCLRRDHAFLQPFSNLANIPWAPLISGIILGNGGHAIEKLGGPSPPCVGEREIERKLKNKRTKERKKEERKKEGKKRVRGERESLKRHKLTLSFSDKGGGTLKEIPVGAAPTRTRWPSASLPLRM